MMKTFFLSSIIRFLGLMSPRMMFIECRYRTFSKNEMQMSTRSAFFQVGNSFSNFRMLKIVRWNFAATRLGHDVADELAGGIADQGGGNAQALGLEPAADQQFDLLLAVPSDVLLVEDLDDRVAVTLVHGSFAALTEQGTETNVPLLFADSQDTRSPSLGRDVNAQRRVLRPDRGRRPRTDCAG